MLIALARVNVEFADGDVDAAERELGVALELARAARLRDTVAQTAARLSLSVVRRDAARAEGLAALSREDAPSESVAAQALWRAATARVTANRNRRRGPRALATEAVRVVPTEMPNLRADLLVELAKILRADGDATGATRAIAEAIDLYDRKGNLVAGARVRSSWPRVTSEQVESRH
jgi:hypothetical protein